jgi:hypothetical protein
MTFEIGPRLTMLLGVVALFALLIGLARIGGKK